MVKTEDYLQTTGGSAFWTKPASFSATGSTRAITRSSSLPPGGNASHVVLKLPMGTYTSSTAGSIHRDVSLAVQEPETINAILKTPKLFLEAECMLDIAFQLHPAINLPTTMSVSKFGIQRSGETEFIACDPATSSVDRASGIGSCTLRGDTCKNTFASTNAVSTTSVSVVYGNGNVQLLSNGVSVEVNAPLAPIPDPATYAFVGTGNVPRVPVYFGLDFPVHVTVNTLVNPLTFWQLKVVFNSSVLELPDSGNADTWVDTGKAFGAASSNVQVVSPTQSILFVSALAVAGGNTPQGKAVDVCTINFKALPQQQQQAKRSVGIISARFESLLTTGSNILVVPDQRVVFNDISASPSSLSAVVEAYSLNPVVGIVAWTNNPNLVLKPDGTPREASAVNVAAVRGGFLATHMPLSGPSVSCLSTGFDGSLSVSRTCSSVIARGTPSSNALVTVGALGGSMTTTVSFMVHSAISVFVEADTGILWPQSCNSSWQSTRIRKWVQFSNGLTTSPVVDVTGTDYDFDLSILGGSIMQKPVYNHQTAMLSPMGPGDFTVVPVIKDLAGRTKDSVGWGGFNVSVMPAVEAGVDTGVSLFAFSDVGWDFATGLSPIFLDRFPMRLEGESHFLTAVKTPSGHFAEKQETLSLIGSAGYVAPNHPEVYAVDPGTTCLGGPPCSFFVGSIARGAYVLAHGFKGKVEVKVRPRDWDAQSTCKIIPWNVTVDIPSPVSARLVVPGGSPAGFKIAIDTGDGSETLYSTRSPPISVLLMMDTGEEVQISAVDPNVTAFNVSGDQKPSVFDILPTTTSDQCGNCVSLGGVKSGGPAVFSLSASIFGGLIKTTSNTLTVTIVAVSAVATESFKVSGSSGDQTVLGRVLQRIGCWGTGIWQQAQLKSDLVMSDGTIQPSVPAVYSCPASQVLDCSSSGRISVKPSASSMITSDRVEFVLVKYLSHSSSMAITVRASQTSGVAIRDAVLTLTPDKGLLRVNKTGALSLEVFLQDGTSIDDWFTAYSQQPAVYSRQTSLFACASSQPDALSIDPYRGVYTALGNSNGPVTLSVVLASDGVCTTTPPGSAQYAWNRTSTVLVNLLPEPVDVDMGSNTKMVPAIPDIIASATQVPIRLTSAGTSILDVRVSVLYPPSLIKATGCSLSQTVSESFQYVDCTLDDSAGIVTITAIASGTTGVPNPISTVGIELAKITFSPQTASTVQGQVLQGGWLISNIDFLQAGSGGLVCGVDPRPACPRTTAGRIIPVKVLGLAAASPTNNNNNRRLLFFAHHHHPAHAISATMVPKTELALSILNSKRTRVDWSNLDLHVISKRLTKSVVVLSTKVATFYVSGDADGGGTFDQDDVRFAMDYYNQADPIGCKTARGCQPRSGITSWQKRALSPINDTLNPSGSRDIMHLFMVFNNKTRFLEDVQNIVSLPGSLRTSVRLVPFVSAADSARTKVRFLYNVSQGTVVSFSNNSRVSQPKQSLMEIEAFHEGSGIFSANLSVMKNASNVGLVVQIQRLNYSGLETADRLVEWHNSNRTGSSLQGFRPGFVIKQIMEKPAFGMINITGAPVVLSNLTDTTIVRGGVSVNIRRGAFAGSSNANATTSVTVAEQSLDTLNLTVPAGATKPLAAAVTIQLDPPNSVPTTSIRLEFSLGPSSSSSQGNRRRFLLQSPGFLILLLDKSTGTWKRLSVQTLAGSSIIGEIQPQDMIDNRLLGGVVACPFEVSDITLFQVAREPGEIAATTPMPTTPAPATPAPTTTTTTPAPQQQSSSYWSDPIFLAIVALGIFLAYKFFGSGVGSSSNGQVNNTEVVVQQQQQQPMPSAPPLQPATNPYFEQQRPATTTPMDSRLQDMFRVKIIQPHHHHRRV